MEGKGDPLDWTPGSLSDIVRKREEGPSRRGVATYGNELDFRGSIYIQEALSSRLETLIYLI